MLAERMRRTTRASRTPRCSVLPTLAGAFCFVFMDERSVYAARDPLGIRPLSIGRLPERLLSSPRRPARSTSSARRSSATSSPASWSGSTTAGCTRPRFAESPRAALCVFEFVYLARPDSRLRGTSVHEARREMGRCLAEEHPAEADMVIAVPDDRHSAAQGYAEVVGHPVRRRSDKNNYVGRTFIQPSQSLRDRGVKLKLNPLPDSIRGKRLVVVDDSIVRGTTTQQIVQVLREAGATEVHLRITSPPIQWPCFYGIDMPTRQELVAAGPDGRRDPRVRRRRLARRTSRSTGWSRPPGRRRTTFCRACFDGEYPIADPGARRQVRAGRAAAAPDRLTAP